MRLPGTITKAVSASGNMRNTGLGMQLKSVVGRQARVSVFSFLRAGPDCLDRGDAQQRNKRRALCNIPAAALTYIQAVFYAQHQFWMPHVVSIATAGDDAKGLKGPARQQLLYFVESHNRNYMPIASEASTIFSRIIARCFQQREVASALVLRLGHDLWRALVRIAPANLAIAPDALHLPRRRHSLPRTSRASSLPRPAPGSPE